MKKVLISILSLMFIVSMITTVYAVTGSVTLSASAENVVKGKTFTVTLAGASDTNVIGIKAKMEYETSKLELVSKKAGDNFTDASANNSEIAIATGGVGAKDATLATYTFKVLDEAEVGTATITVSNIVLAADTNISISENKTISINIKSDDTTAGNQNNQGNNNTTQETPSNTTGNGNNTNGNTNTDSGNKNTNTNKNVNTNKNTNKKPTKLPQTGIESASIVAIITIVALGISSYVSYRKYKNI